ncbi:PIG-S family GPI transamidase component [Pararhizobium sp. YC-54]|uniref:PIG-S family GPI transamidase component n=1 Tax=Pararhizobium sp. YC-54 TaxID=2986920 RepID=UPI0021F7E764|nr:PIG-S family GPI transamidase component [Pararhizobium sp. YC-54]MCV9997847.1 PIG-S family GPI transamidase component [Pararhizobium sp. YC-54]
MAEDKLDTIALLKAIADSPKRDNSVYHRAMAEARQAFEEAESALGGPVRMRSKTKMKRNGEFTVKWTFKRGS